MVTQTVLFCTNKLPETTKLTDAHGKVVAWWPVQAPLAFHLAEFTKYKDETRAPFDLPVKLEFVPK